MKRTLLLDGDVFAYQSACVSETQIQWDEDQYTLNGDLAKAKQAFMEQVDRLVDKLKADTAVVCFSDSTRHYFRKDLFPTYKAHRKATRKPLGLFDLVAWINNESGLKCYTKPGLEGDDVIGILATDPTIIKGEKVVVSVDKDFFSVPGLFYRIKDEEVVPISPAEADYFHMHQTLVGDTSDGYPGCPGIGPKKADTILTEKFGVAAMWEAVVATFEKKGLNEAAALLQARLARILRSSDYNFKTKTPILWNPPVKGSNAETNPTIQ